MSFDRRKFKSWKTKARGVLAISQYTDEVAQSEALNAAAAAQYLLGGYPLHPQAQSAMVNQQRLLSQYQGYIINRPREVRRAAFDWWGLFG